MIADFKKFIAKGNVMNLAVAVIIGAAFGKIVSELVNSIIMPLIGLVMGGVDFSVLAMTVGSAQVTYGLFIQALIDFLVIAIVVFLLVRAVQNMKKPTPDKPAEVKDCPYCFTTINIKATRCPNCTSELSKAA